MKKKRGGVGFGALPPSGVAQPNHTKGSDFVFSEALKAHQSGYLNQARALYELSIAQGHRIADSWANLSVIAFQSGDFLGTKTAAEQAISLNPNDGNSYNNLGLALKGLQDIEQAIDAFKACVARSPKHGIAWINLAYVLYLKGRWEEAIKAAEKALRLNQTLPEILEMGLYLKLETASWEGLDLLLQKVNSSIQQGNVLNPYSLFSTCLDPNSLLQAGYNKSILVVHQNRDIKPWDGRKVSSSGKIRVGYFSSALRTHPTGYLIREVIALLNRDRFETLAIPNSPYQEDDFTRDLLAKFDQVISVADFTNAEAVQTIRDLHLDILIDLDGYADGGRTHITAARCAPLQVSWLGYAAPMGASFIDYTISDLNVTPDGLVPTISGAVLRLPRTFFPSDPNRSVSQRFTCRTELGLPENGLVFCAFNQTRKITPAMVKVWAQLLKLHPHSVLWLWKLNEISVGNISAKVQELGVNPDRIVWAPALPSPDHLCRYRFVDLYLDTFPYNGHTTVNDALFMGVPVVTLAGQTMPSRVAGSFLALMGVGGLIANTPEEYLHIAHQLALNPDLRRQAKAKIVEGANLSKLFSAQAFVREFEAGLTAIVTHARQGNSPASISIPLQTGQYS